MSEQTSDVVKNETASTSAEEALEHAEAAGEEVTEAAEELGEDFGETVDPATDAAEEAGDDATEEAGDDAAEETGGKAEDAAASDEPETPAELDELESEESEPEPQRTSSGIGHLVVVGIFSLLLGVLLCLPSFLGSGSAASGAAAATVNGKEISEDSVTEYIMSFRSIQNLERDGDWGSWMVSYDYTPEKLRATTIDFFVTRELLAQAAEENGVDVPDSEVDEQYNQVVEQAGGEDKLKELISAQGMTTEDYRNSIKLSLQQSALAEKVVDQTPEIDDDMVLAYLKMYYVDAVPQDAESLEGIDEEIVSSMRDMIKESMLEEGFENWMSEYQAKADVVVKDMPEGLPYAIDLAPYLDREEDEDELEAASEDSAAAEGDEEESSSAASDQ